MKKLLHYSSRLHYTFLVKASNKKFYYTSDVAKSTVLLDAILSPEGLKLLFDDIGDFLWFISACVVDERSNSCAYLLLFCWGDSLSVCWFSLVTVLTQWAVLSTWLPAGGSWWWSVFNSAEWLLIDLFPVLFLFDCDLVEFCLMLGIFSVTSIVKLSSWAVGGLSDVSSWCTAWLGVCIAGIVRSTPGSNLVEP